MHRAALVEQRVDDGGHNHAAHRGEHGKQGLTRTTQLADGHLVLELNAHEQEEDRHEEVVDEDLDRDRHGELTDAHMDRLHQEMVDHLISICVGTDHCCNGGKHHHGGGNGAVLKNALPRVAALDALPLLLGKQLLACVHGAPCLFTARMPRRAPRETTPRAHGYEKSGRTTCVIRTAFLSNTYGPMVPNGYMRLKRAEGRLQTESKTRRQM
ncbi:Uncharacterised protein [Collinsella intestinalis]|nr:Uncharacterised protein [Collinsella intestinalis]